MQNPGERYFFFWILTPEFQIHKKRDSVLKTGTTAP